MNPPGRSTARLSSGTLVITAIVLAAVAASTFAWWHQYRQGHRALDYWTTGGAKLIRQAGTVELIRLGEPAEVDARSAMLGREIATRQDISRTPGLVHARQALISDASFLWDGPPDATPDWEYVLRFADEGGEFLVALDLTGGFAGTTGDRPSLRLGPTLRKGLKTFFAELEGGT